MKVLFTTRGSSGHVGPLVPFAQACIRAGHDVVVTAQHRFEGNVTRAGLPYRPVGEPSPDEWMPLMERFGDLTIAAGNEVMISQFFAGLDLRAELADLNEVVETVRPDLIVRESWEFGSTLVGERHGVPVARVGLGVAEVEEMTIELAAPEVDRARAQHGLSADPEGQRLRAGPYLTSVPEELGGQTAATSQAARFRFAVDEGGALPDWWPGNDDPLVYLTFGSVAAGAHLPYYPALYRRAVDALASLPIRLLVTIGDADRDLAELGRVPANVHVETWVPHDDVARHADVIVCHGGFGSTLGALAHGTPLVVLPLFSSDQWANGEAVARTGAGITVADDQGIRKAVDLPADTTLNELAPAVSTVLEDARFRDGARGIADAIRNLPPVDEAVAILEAAAR